jgi:phenylacetate-CoA ligase
MTDSKVTAARSKAYLDALTRFLGTPLEDLVFRQNDGSPNPEAAQKNALRMFSLASSEINGVPAYKEFLKAQGVDASKIDRFDAWDTVPWVEKSNYVNLYPLSNRSFAGTMSDFDVLHVSSGSGGKPTAWGRVAMDELFIAQRFEQVFRNSFKADLTKTLAINMLPLGTWVGGLFTFQCVRNLSLKGYDVTSISTGVDVGEILRVIRELGPLYDSVVVLAYPPFFKTVVDAGNRAGIPWPSYNVKCVFAGEVFSESWRDLLMQRAGITSLSHIVSIYGTADGGVLGCESPLSTAIRRFFASKPEVARKIFGKDRLPSLMQYDPCQRMIELTPEDTLAFSTLVPSDWSGEGHGPYAAGVLAPLIRYNIGDAGGIKPFDEMMAFCRENGFDPVPEAEKMGGDRAVVKMPFVWVFGRRFWTVSLYGANVYLENLM